MQSGDHTSQGRVKRFFRRVMIPCVLVGAVGTVVAQTFSVTDPTRSADGLTYYWKPMIQAGSYPPSYIGDPAADQQTGQGEDDIVGDALNPGVFVRFGQIQGVDHVAFRIVENKSYGTKFTGQAAIGLDTDLDGSLDVVFTAVGKNQSNGINYQDPGTGANTSPSSTTLSAPVNLAGFTSSNFNYQTINSTLYPGWTQVGTDPDAVLTFAIPFATVNSTLQLLGETQITSTSLIRMVAFTANQNNSINQDVYGIAAGGSSSTVTFASFAEIMDSTGKPIPEPSTWISLGTTLGAGWLMYRGRRKRREAAGSSATETRMEA